MEITRVAGMVHRALTEAGVSEETVDEIIEDLADEPKILAFFLAYEKQVLAAVSGVPINFDPSINVVTVFGDPA